MTQATVPIDAQCAQRAPDRPAAGRRMAAVLALTALVMVVEAVGGWVSHSLTLLADAGHMLTDVGALALALIATRLAQQPATPGRTFGLLRIEILAALVNGAVLIVIAAGIGLEAWQRLREPAAVHGGVLLAVALVGLGANLAGAAILHRGHEHSLNQRSAYLHVVSDLLGSVAAVLAGGVILLTGWTPIDPILSVAIGVLILRGAWRLVRESADVLLEAVPAHISLGVVHDRLTAIEGVHSVHDLHVWTVTSGVVAMSAHLVTRGGQDDQRVLAAARDRMGALGIHHVTVQVEQDTACC